MRRKTTIQCTTGKPYTFKLKESHRVGWIIVPSRWGRGRGTEIEQSIVPFRGRGAVEIEYRPIQGEGGGEAVEIEQSIVPSRGRGAVEIEQSIVPSRVGGRGGSRNRAGYSSGDSTLDCAFLNRAKSFCLHRISVWMPRKQLK